MTVRRKGWLSLKTFRSVILVDRNHRCWGMCRSPWRPGRSHTLFLSLSDVPTLRISLWSLLYISFSDTHSLSFTLKKHNSSVDIHAHVQVVALMTDISDYYNPNSSNNPHWCPGGRFGGAEWGWEEYYLSFNRKFLLSWSRFVFVCFWNVCVYMSIFNNTNKMHVYKT